MYVLVNVQDRLQSIRRMIRRALQDHPGETHHVDVMLLKDWMYQVGGALVLVC